MNYVYKLKVEFDGWHKLPKKTTQEILVNARKIFLNTNFFENSGLIIEHHNQSEIFTFCLKILETYQNLFKNWDGYVIRKVSKNILNNYADKKRKLKFEVFKKLNYTYIDKTSILLAGVLYLEPSFVEDILLIIQDKLNRPLKLMTEDQLEKAYKLLLNYSSYELRKFSLHV